MKNFQNLGGLGALLLAALFVLTTVIVLVILPAQGLPSSELNNPTKVLPLATSPGVVLSNMLNVLYGISVILVVLALYERLRVGSSAAVVIASAAGLIAVALFLASGGIRMFGTLQLGRIYAENQAGAAAAFLALRSVASGVGNMAFFAFAWWALLISWAALQQAALPKPVSYIGLLWGVLAFIAFISATLGQELAPLGLLLGVVWFGWLGIALLREPARVTAPAMSGA